MNRNQLFNKLLRILFLMQQFICVVGLLAVLWVKLLSSSALGFEIIVLIWSFIISICIGIAVFILGIISSILSHNFNGIKLSFFALIVSLVSAFFILINLGWGV